jgi:hypothetical protein
MPRDQNRKVKQKCGGVVYSCEKCNHTVELEVAAKVNKIDTIKPVTKEPKNARSIKKEAQDESKSLVQMKSLTPSVLPLYVKVTHKGFWVTDESTKLHVGTMNEKCERNSIMLTNDCILYKLKIAIRHRFICKGLIEPYEIDPQNLVPHIVVRKSPGDSSSQFKAIQGEYFKIDECDLSVKSQFLLIELDKTRGLHMTMIFSKGLKKECPDLIGEFKDMLAMLLDPKNQHLLQEYADLPYFAQDAVGYWKETADQYPLNVTPPADWKPSTKKVIDVSALNLSPIGSVITF